MYLLILVGCSPGGSLGTEPATPSPTITSGNERIVVEWQDISDANYYNIYWSSTDPTLSDESTEIIERADSPFYLDKLENGKLYYLSVSAIGVGGESSISVPLSISPLPPPSAPQITSVAVEDESITIQWGNVGNATSYTLYIAREAGVRINNIESLSGWMIRKNVTSPFTQTGLINGRDHYMVLTAESSSGESTESSEVSAIPTAYVFFNSGHNHACSIRADHTLWCWGKNNDSQIGDGSQKDIFKPVKIGERSDWKMTAAGEQHTCAITFAGNLWCWGLNFNFQLGHSRAGQLNTPEMTDNADSWKFITAGKDNTCGIKDNGSLWCWGENVFGKFGVTTRSLAKIVTSEQTWINVTAGYLHICGIKTDRSLWCWGNNTDGQLGITNIINEPIPVNIETGSTWIAITAGENHTCAIKTDQSLWCWGNNDFGQTGDGSYVSKTVPTQIIGNNKWLHVSAGANHTCAITVSHVLWCWGNNKFNQIKSMTSITDNRFPQPQQVGSGIEWDQLSLGSNHTCAIKFSGEIYCFGINSSAQLGINVNSNDLAPTNIQLNQTVAKISLEVNNTCLLRNNNTVSCWGNNDHGQLGNNTLNPEQQPVLLENNKNWSSISNGRNYTCAIDDVNSIWCWGSNDDGQLGLGDTLPRLTPKRITDLIMVNSINTNYLSSCAIKIDGSMWCWGKLFGASPSDFTATAQQIGNSTNWQQVAVGSEHACALNTLADIYCWGTNISGELGNNTIINNNKLTPIINNNNWKDIAVGDAHSCALKLNGSIWCWGDNNFGQVKILADKNILVPIQINNDFDWENISANNFYSCAIKTNGTLWCWGLDLAFDENNITPVPVSKIGSDTDWVDVQLARTHYCAIKRDASVWCWGNNKFGQLGNNRAWISELTRVELP